MNENHIVKVLYNERGFCRTRPVFQYDYGQVLQLEGFPEGMLPAAYEVHFDIGNNTVSCPNCNSWFHLENAHYMYYCGHCGCKMKPINVAENNNPGNLIVTVKKKGFHNLK